MNVATTETAADQDTVPHPDGRVSVPRLGEVGQLAGRAGAHHLHRAQLNVSWPGVVVISSS